MAWKRRVFSMHRMLLAAAAIGGLTALTALGAAAALWPPVFMRYRRNRFSPTRTTTGTATTGITVIGSMGAGVIGIDRTAR
jgi:hypothetical protein